MHLLRYLLFFALITSFYTAHCQQDVNFHLNATFLSGKNIIKVKRDFYDPYVWVLAQNNEVYRINSITNVVDNYTAKFASHNNLAFIDIAGWSKDVVFIATNSTNVLEYKNGPIKVIGTADGITGIVNSVGVNIDGDKFNFAGAENVVMIATSKGICRYDYDTETILPVTALAESRIYEATYRSEMMSNGQYGRGYQDTVEMFPVFFFADRALFGGELWMGAHAFGHTLKSAFYTRGSTYGNLWVATSANQFWATEKGLFQNNWNYSFRTDVYPYRHYLNGLDISKITSIFGLVSLSGPYDSGFPRENVLVGTNKGLYFSNSHYQGTIPQYDFFHYDGLGNKTINDICVNSTSYTKIVTCEDGIWIAATDGLYLLKPDYSILSNSATKLLKAIQFDGQDAGVKQFQLCSNTSIKAILNTSIYSGGVMQWYKNGKEIPGKTTPELEITEAGDYYLLMYDPCSTTRFQTNHLKVTQASAPVFTFNYPDELIYCDGSVAVLKTTENPVYQYRWYKNSSIINGSTTSTLNITENGNYKVEVSACNGSWVSSKTVKINFIKVPEPVVTADKAAYCDGEQARLIATVPIDGSNIINWSAYQYRWYKDGVLYGNNSQSELVVTENGKYKVEVKGCNGIWVPSTQIPVNFIKLQQPVIASDKPAYCTGDVAQLSIPFVNDGTYIIRWFKNGALLRDDLNKTAITAGIAANYTVSISSNLSTCSQVSQPYTLIFDTPPTLSIQQLARTTFCDGQTVDLQATYSGGMVTWSTGESADKIGINQSGTYTASVSTPAGCSVTQSTEVHFFPNPVISVPDATLCNFSNESVTLSAPSGYVKYEWNGQTGGTTFITDKLGQVTLTVTDNNGCTATQVITVSNHCKDIYIPNTFTPNGDGTNDTWAISGLDGDQSVQVTVYNRYGTAIFQNKGYSIPWNGTYNGKALPAGVYYYIIKTQRTTQIINGYVTIIR